MTSANPSGPKDADILIISDFPRPLDVMRGELFTDTDGHELRKMLAEAGIALSRVRFTSLLKTLPPGGDIERHFDFGKKLPLSGLIPEASEKIKKEIFDCNPNIIIPLGGLALYAIMRDSAISTWRGSLLSFEGYKCIPTYTPLQILSSWEWRGIAITDLKRAARLSYDRTVPQASYSFTIRPSADTVLGLLAMLQQKVELSQTRLSVDLETRGGHTACIGIAWSRTEALCIPLMCVERNEGFYTEGEELAITLAVRKLLTHPNAFCVGQNFLYDAQYFAKHNGFVPNLRADTMFQQHILFPGMPKGLDFLASMYCEHYTYWKSEGKLWNPKIPEEQLWSYNCKDACITYEVSEVLEPLIRESGLQTQYEFQMSLWRPVLDMMLRGIRINMELRKRFGGELFMEAEARNAYITQLLGHPINIRSPLKMKALFYEDFKLPVQRAKGGKRQPTTDDAALKRLGEIEPLVLPLTRTMRELRSIGVFHSTFVNAQVGLDGRMRSSFNPTGTETYRFNSAKDAFDEGTNLQNVPAGDEDEVHEPGALILPNIRKLFIPSSEHLIVDVDLAGADAQVVAYEAEDELLKAVFKSGEKLHAVNAKDMFGGNAGPDGKQQPYYGYAKAGCHLTNYGGNARTLSKATGMTMYESEKFQFRWFDIHPGIREWHRRTENQLFTRRYVENKFGYRRFYFERLDRLLPQALAWIPQSTVACVTNRQLVSIDRNLPKVKMLLQVHDSLVFEVHRSDWFISKPLIREHLKVVIPYDDPLVIPSGLKVSAISWGDCEEEKW
jgi:DNA polymerase I-like protein with 3'-5' exonuclease and polymerase domains/uracil-DNA glycosylase